MSQEKIKSIRYSIGRAKGYLRRDEFLKSIDCAVLAFQDRALVRLMGKVKYEIEFLLIEYCDTFSRHVKLIKLLEKMKIRRKPFISYECGQETNVVGKLEIVRTRLADMEREAEENTEAKCLQRKKQLLAKGQELLDKGEKPRGKGLLRRAIDEFGDEPGLMADVGRRFVEAELFVEAKDVLQKAVEKFPAEAAAYKHLVTAYKAEGEYEKAEELYLNAIKRFGNHPMTLLNLSKLYAEMRKRDKAFDYAKMALDADPSLAEAKEIIEKYA